MAPDALLLVSFGGPEGPDEVMPFLERVTAGRGVPRERLESVAEHYLAMGGVSPINGQNRDLLAALRSELDARGVDLPLYWGNRNSAPFLADVLAQIRADGHRSVRAITTSAYPSYSGCRQYRENLAGALSEAGLQDELDIEVVGPYYDRDGFRRPFADGLEEALAAASREDVSEQDITVLFTTHSIPTGMDEASGPDGQRDDGPPGLYTRAHLEVARAVMERTGSAVEWRLVFQSRSGPPQVPWLEPDVNDALEEEAEAGITHAILVPIGFISDHMEVVWDLDNEAAATAQRLGIGLARVPTPGVHAAFVGLLADELLAEDRPPCGFCADSCCRNARGDRPVVPGICSRA